MSKPEGLVVWGALIVSALYLLAYFFFDKDLGPIPVIFPCFILLQYKIWGDNK